MQGRKLLSFILMVLIVHLFNVLKGQDTSYTFGDVEVGATDSIWVSLRDHIIGDQDVYCYFDEFSLGPVIPGADSVKVYFTPSTNVAYNGVILVTTDESFLPGNVNRVVAVVDISGNGRLNDPYYASTFDLSDEPLKNELHDLIDGHNSLGYSPARDEMFMNIDNWKVNGRGASSNTLQGVYTGQLAVGYNDRQDAQNNYGFNTEHTFPQGTFDSDEPMRSDLHHLFPTKIFANSERGNKPFGVVSNPTWQEGGSRSNSVTFEPRDQQKGAAARAMLYFLIRYRNYQNYVSAKDQDVLMDWASNFGPDSIERRRNEDIYKVQNNRNPFVDYPLFLDRIHNFIGASTSPEVISYEFTTNSKERWAFLSDTDSKRFAIVNTGNVALELNKVQASNKLIIDSFDLTIPAGNAGSIYLRGLAGDWGTTDTIFFEFQQNLMDTVLVERINIMGITDQSFRKLKLYPNPAQAYINFSSTFTSPTEYMIFDVHGRIQKAGILLPGQKSLPINRLVPGIYLVKVVSGKNLLQGRIVIRE